MGLMEELLHAATKARRHEKMNSSSYLRAFVASVSVFCVLGG
jgi:hypothetical protein